MEIIDNGIGIEEVILGFVFNEYFIIKGLGYGSGLGLVVCWLLIWDVGGDIMIVSRLGVGMSVMVFFLILENENGMGNGVVNGE